MSKSVSETVSQSRAPGSMPGLFITGGAHVDRLARLEAPHIKGTSNPVGISEGVGGGGFNAGRAARRFGIAVSMVSARGGDAGGAMVEEALSAAGITDLSGVHLDRATPSYTAILQPDGELVTAIADMALYETAMARSFRRAPVQQAAKRADAVLCDANLSASGLVQMFDDLAQDKPVYALAVSARKAKRLSGFLPRLACLFLNRFEAAALTGLPETTATQNFAEELQAKSLPRAVITAGSGPAACLDGQEICLLTPPPVTVVDVTGAGDCLAGTMVAALLLGKDFMHAARLGLCAASITASRHGASPDIALNEIEALAASHEWIAT
jgi:sugar/nucleoside kinase (ribokinase family)